MFERLRCKKCGKFMTPPGMDQVAVSDRGYLDQGMVNIFKAGLSMGLQGGGMSCDACGGELEVVSALSTDL